MKCNHCIKDKYADCVVAPLSSFCFLSDENKHPQIKAMLATYRFIKLLHLFQIF